MNQNPKKVLIAIGFQPYPTLFGGAVDVWERIVGLVSLGHIVDIVFTEKSKPAINDLNWIQGIVNQVFFVQRNNSWKQLFSNQPLQVLSRAAFKNVSFDATYDFVILEGEFCAPIIDNPSLNYNKLIVRIHNDESYYFDQLKESVTSFKEKIYYSLEAPKIRTYSKRVLDQADRLWYISSDEFKRSKYSSKSIFLPVPINDEFIDFQSVHSNEVLFVGSLFMPNNIFALDWFLTQIHPELISRENYKFVVVGAVKSDEEKDRILKKYAKFQKVEFHFNEKNLSVFYKKAKVFVNPMFHGSGVKIKSVMALVNALPLVSTTVGAEGIGLTDDMFWKANDKQTFLEALIEIFELPENQLQNKVDAAQYFLKSNHYLKVLNCEMNSL